jgi:hypothetical protein
MVRTFHYPGNVPPLLAVMSCLHIKLVSRHLRQESDQSSRILKIKIAYGRPEEKGCHHRLAYIGRVELPTQPRVRKLDSNGDPNGLLIAFDENGRRLGFSSPNSPD